MISSRSTMVDPSNQSKLAYDALQDKGRRKRASSVIVREDREIGKKRNQLRQTVNETAKNFAAVAWAIRRHLDYVALFDFHCRSKDPGLNRDIEFLMERDSRPTNFDAGGRLSREKFFRLMESRRVLDGDVGQLYLFNGTSQGIESDLIRDPDEDKKNNAAGREWVDGVEIDGAGYPYRFSLHTRKPSPNTGYQYSKTINASNLALYGFFERFASDQVRGISPVTSAINHFQDVKENIDYTLIKTKIHQIFALAFSRKSEATALDEVFPAGGEVSEDHAPQCSDEIQPRQIDLSGGPTVFDLDPDESVDLLESKNPSNEFQQFSQTVLMIALKSLDIPYSFFDEAHTNYSGARGSWLQYERSTFDKRADQIELRRRWTYFKLTKWMLNDELTIPRSMSLADIHAEWVPLGMPWWKPSEEIVGDLKAIASGLNNPQRIAKERGTGDVFDNIDQTIAVIKHARDKGIELLGEPFNLNFDVQFPAPTLDAKA